MLQGLYEMLIILSLLRQDDIRFILHWRECLVSSQDSISRYLSKNFFPYIQFLPSQYKCMSSFSQWIWQDHIVRILKYLKRCCMYCFFKFRFDYSLVSLPFHTSLPEIQTVPKIPQNINQDFQKVGSDSCHCQPWSELSEKPPRKPSQAENLACPKTSKVFSLWDKIS